MPYSYVVIGGNALWLEEDTVYWAPLSRVGSILWNDAGEVEDWAGLDPVVTRKALELVLTLRFHN